MLQAYPVNPGPGPYQPIRMSAGPTPFPGMLSPADLAAATSALRLSAGASFESGFGGMGTYAAPPTSLPLDACEGWTTASTAPSADPSAARFSAGSNATLSVGASTVGSPTCGSPPNSLSGAIPLPSMHAGLRIDAQAVADAASWGLTGGAFTSGLDLARASATTAPRLSQ